MGEKIRDLKTIKIGENKLTIELNEGYSKGEGRLIHIQNTHFRYLISEHYFLQLASTILRAKSEMVYYKKSTEDRINTKHMKPHIDADTVTNSAIQKFIDMLNHNSIDYRFIESGMKFGTVIINNEYYDKFQDCIKETEDLRKHEHPHGEMFDYIFLYQMKPFELYSIDQVYIEVYFQLPCLSLQPRTWIPLDRIIQDSIWQQQNIDMAGINHIDTVSLCVYRLCWAIFMKNGFSDYDRKLLTRNRMLFENTEFKRALEVVFFNYTNTLLEYLKNDQYEKIIPTFYKFNEY